MKKHYYTIGEVGNLLDLKPYVIRYWETEFHQLRPRKDEGRIRKYSEENILLLKKIKAMLYDQKFTIEGARQKLKVDRKAQRSYEDLKQGEQAEIRLEDTSHNHESTTKQKHAARELRSLLQQLISKCHSLQGSNK
ncbi:MAG: MerR family transcriptional regulator [Candidatus Cloacimonadota bacterium]